MNIVFCEQLTSMQEDFYEKKKVTESETSFISLFIPFKGLKINLLAQPSEQMSRNWRQISEDFPVSVWQGCVNEEHLVTRNEAVMQRIIMFIFLQWSHCVTPEKHVSNHVRIWPLVFSDWSKITLAGHMLQ